MSWVIDEFRGTEPRAWQELTARLISGATAGFRIPGFASPARCSALAALLTAESPGIQSYVAANVTATHLGAPAISFSGRPEAYFAAARRWNDWQRQIFGRPDAWNAPQAVVEALGIAFPGLSCAVAEEPGQGRYFHGIIRCIARAPLHSDFALRDFPGWRIGRVRRQLAWNIYLTTPQAGEGQTAIYRRSWTASDEVFKTEHGVGYGAAVVAGAERAAYVPQAGELMIFNCVNYHEVTTSRDGSGRLSIGGFIGFDEGSASIVFWS